MAAFAEPKTNQRQTAKKTQYLDQLKHLTLQITVKIKLLEQSNSIFIPPLNQKFIDNFATIPLDIEYPNCEKSFNIQCLSFSKAH